MMGRTSPAVMAFALLAGCATERLDGVNLLQSREVSFTQPPTYQSLRAARALGANTVAVVTFLEQTSPESTRLRKSRAVSDAQLVGAIRAAKRAGVKVFVKPQLLIPDAWAGAIDPGSDAGWEDWFDAYRTHLVELAVLAESEDADGFVVGTELGRSASRAEWSDVIAAVRNVFSGTLTYAAHGVEGLNAFSHWHLLDLAGVTLYPSLGNNPERGAMQAHVEETTAQLRGAADRIGKPVWITEIGIQSRHGAQERPWEWRGMDADAPPDSGLQATVIDLWLEALAGDWNRGVLLWAWSNDPLAGGPNDRDYLLQNKPAEQVMRCRWKNLC
mgnify:CR=1 FL=1|tara:strand:- start:162 stop:1151 length:990 start_codon:yes stop_codon:yes gene_type:complete